MTYRGRSWTWAQWDDRVRRAAGGLRALGVGRGDVVAFLDKNHPACVELSLAAGSLGAANAIINWRLAGDEVDYAVNDSGAKVLVVGSELMPTVEAIRDRLPGVRARGRGDPGRRRRRRLRGAARRRPPRCRGPADVDPDDVCLVMYSSGTTGPTQGGDAHPHQHGPAHPERPRRLGVRARRQVDGVDAALPRRRLVVRPLLASTTASRA